MADEIPQWAIDQAKRRFDDEMVMVRARGGLNYWEHWQEAFARYIAEHEEAPVDPLLRAIENAWADGCCHIEHAERLREALPHFGLKIVEAN